MMFNGTGDGTVTQRIAPLPGMDAGTLGYAGVDKAGPTIKNKVPSVLGYIVLDLLLFNYLTGWGAAAAFYGFGSFVMHADAPKGELAVLAFISWKALTAAAVLVVKDGAVWLNKLRQAHGIFQ